MAITHDIDHLGIKDHCRDMAIPKFVVLNLAGLLRRALSVREFFTVLREIVRSLCGTGYDSWLCLDRWLDLEKKADVKSDWFVVCRKGRGISYEVQKARPVVEKLIGQGFTVGLHSQCRDSVEELPREVEEFRQAYGIERPIPVRMHYLAEKASDLDSYRELFTYDSSIFDEQAFSTDTDFNRPINIMDTFFFCPIRRECLTLEQAQARTRTILSMAEEQGRNVVVDFHQRSLSPCFPRYREYILWFYETFGGRIG